MQRDNRARSCARARARARAFTLVELAIVVAIVGVLAVIGVVSYRKFMLSAKVSEAQNMISAIRVAQEDYKVERGIYANMGAGFCPTNGMALVKSGWNTTCAGGGVGPLATWAGLSVHADGPVQFGYSAVAPPAAVPVISWVDMTAGTAIAATRPWYVIQAQADLNGDGAAGVQTELVGTSFQNTIFSHNEGE